MAGLRARRAAEGQDPLKGSVRLAVDGGLATVTLDQPHKRNAQDPTLWAELAEAGRALPQAVRVVLVRGEGRSFSAGLDRAQFPLLAELGRDADAASRISGFQHGFTWLSRPDLVSIAVVQGHAVGAGFQLALACDLRVAAEDAVFAMAEVSLGIVPDLAGTHPLVAAVGLPRALEWCLTGRQVPAQEALQAGLVNRVVPIAELDTAAVELAQAILGASRDAVREIKALLQGAGSRTPPEQWKAEREAQVRLLRTLVQEP